jgi:hypothetical protein
MTFAPSWLLWKAPLDDKVEPASNASLLTMTRRHPFVARGPGGVMG